jgi:transglutaminase-like putative cysteine protease
VIASRRAGDRQIEYSDIVDPIGVRDAAIAIARRYQGGIWNIAQVVALFHFVRDMDYIADPAGMDDFVQAPVKTLQLRAGNCEGKSLLLASLLRAVGIRSRLLYIRRPPLAHLLVEACVEDYDLNRLHADAASLRLEPRLLRLYERTVREQYSEVDGKGHRWLIADPCFSRFAGDISLLVRDGWMRKTATGAPWMHPPVYFSDGSDRPFTQAMYKRAASGIAPGRTQPARRPYWWAHVAPHRV